MQVVELTVLIIIWNDDQIAKLLVNLTMKLAVAVLISVMGKYL